MPVKLQASTHRCGRAWSTLLPAPPRKSCNDDTQTYVNDTKYSTPANVHVPPARCLHSRRQTDHRMAQLIGQVCYSNLQVLPLPEHASASCVTRHPAPSSPVAGTQCEGTPCWHGVHVACFFLGPNPDMNPLTAVETFDISNAPFFCPSTISARFFSCNTPGTQRGNPSCRYLQEGAVCKLPSRFCRTYKGMCIRLLDLTQQRDGCSSAMPCCVYTDMCTWTCMYV